MCLTTGEQNSYSPDFQRYSLDLCHMPMKHAQSKNAKKKNTIPAQCGAKTCVSKGVVVTEQSYTV